MDNKSKSFSIAIDACICAIFVVLTFIGLHSPLSAKVVTICLGSIFLAMYNDKKYFRIFRLFLCCILFCLFFGQIHTWLLYILPNYLALTFLSLIKKDNIVKFIVYTIVFFFLSIFEDILYCKVVLNVNFVEYIVNSNKYFEIMQEQAYAQAAIIAIFVFAALFISIGESIFFFGTKKLLNKRLGHLIEKI